MLFILIIDNKFSHTYNITLTYKLTNSSIFLLAKKRPSALLMRYDI
jgi:hypothetical protein